MNIEKKSWAYNVEALSTYGCGHCGSDDLGFFGDTPDRTDNDNTDHVECESCGAEWHSPAVNILTRAAESFGAHYDQDVWTDALGRADAIDFANMADEDALIVARGILATSAGI
jgi:hypothetical protein